MRAILTRLLFPALFLFAGYGCKATKSSTVKDDMALSPMAAEGPPIVVITDMEPDDRVALMLLASQVPPSRIAFMGTTVLHAKRKKALLCQLNQQLGYGSVPVYQGRGHVPEYYQNSTVTMNGAPTPIGTATVDASGGVLTVRSVNTEGTDQQISASGAARAYTNEGQILDQYPVPGWRAQLNDWLLQPTNNSEAARNSSALTEQLVSYLNALNGKAIILLLAAPTELAEALAAHPELAAKIERVYLQGGWQTVGTLPKGGTANEPLCPTGTMLLDKLAGLTQLPSTEAAAAAFPKGWLCVSTYNWDMDIGASTVFMKNAAGLNMTLLSSHVIKTVFPSGSINDDTPAGNRIWKTLDSQQLQSMPSVLSTKQEMGNWDAYIIANLRKTPNPSAGLLATITMISKFADRQFTPADPAVVAALLQDGVAPLATKPVVTSTTGVDVTLMPSVVVRTTGWAATYDRNEQSPISLVTGIDAEAFGELLSQSLLSLKAGSSAEANPSCAEFAAQ